MGSPQAPADGVYYLSASLNFEMGNGDEVACQFSPDQQGTETARSLKIMKP